MVGSSYYGYYYDCTSTGELLVSCHSGETSISYSGDYFAVLDVCSSNWHPSADDTWFFMGNYYFSKKDYLNAYNTYYSKEAIFEIKKSNFREIITYFSPRIIPMYNKIHKSSLSRRQKDKQKRKQRLHS